MSVVGPRPERLAFCAEFEKRIRGWHYRSMATLGLSGLAQVTGGYDLLPKEKVAMSPSSFMIRQTTFSDTTTSSDLRAACTLR